MLVCLHPQKMVNANEKCVMQQCYVYNQYCHTTYDEKLTKIMDESLHKKIDGIYNEVDAADRFMRRCPGNKTRILVRRTCWI